MKEFEELLSVLRRECLRLHHEQRIDRFDGCRDSSCCLVRMGIIVGWHSVAVSKQLLWQLLHFKLVI